MMRTHGVMGSVLTVAVAAGLMGGCENLPGNRGTQGAVIGGVAGGAAGAAVGGEENRLLGALIGAAAGAGGGYLIGAETEKAADADDEDQQDARRAVEEAQADPATPEEVAEAETADLNDDGFVTMDEVMAMADAGLNDDEMLRRLEATDQVFELTSEQEEDLMNSGVSRRVVREMQTLNQEARERVLQERNDVISRDRDGDL